jgi:hypothetical protein
MPVPIICLDEHARHFAERFGKLFSKPQYQYLVIVLLGLMRMSRADERSRDWCVRLRIGRACRTEPESRGSPLASSTGSKPLAEALS